MSCRCAVLPPLKTVRAGLLRTTEALATELASPGGATPAWSDLEWRLAMAAAVAHGISPLLWKHSGWAYPPWRRFLENQHEHVAIRHTRIAALLKRIDTAARTAGLAMTPLKGVALHALGVYAPGGRPMADIDLLIHEDDADAAIGLMRDIGYVPSFDHWRHQVFKPATGTAPATLGEHRDTPINIELHPRIREQLPISVTDITEWIRPHNPEPGLNAYPSRNALLAHLLLHAAGNICGRSLRLMHLHDIALLARSMQPEEWVFLWQGGACWWALPPLQMVARYYPDAIPDVVLTTLERDCPLLLRMVAHRQILSQVSCSELWLHAFPGIEWSRSLSDATRFVIGRIRPPAEKKRERADMVRTQLWLQDGKWITATQRKRILTWLIRKVPRMDVMYVVRKALAYATPTAGGSPRSPEVSVILPTWNRLPLLRKAVDSVLAQTHRDFELIVVDDGSTDGTRDYLESIEDPRVRPIGLEHRGDLTSARSAGLCHARGEWVAFLDSDDLWLPEKLTLQLQRLAMHPECRWSYTGYLLVDADERLLPERSALLGHPISGCILEPLLKFEVAVAVQAMLVQRSLIDEIGGFDEAIPIRSDYDFTLRLAARSEVCALPENLTWVREHAGRTTAHLRHVDIYVDQERVFRKAAATAANHQIRALCLRQCATQLAGQAGALSQEGSHRAAFAALVRAARFTPFDQALWRTAVGCAVRTAGWK